MRNRPSMSLAFLAVACLGPLACEGTPAPVTPPTPEVGPAQPEHPSFAPAPEPADIVGVVRWKNPNATVTALSNCAGVPGELAEGGIKPGLELMFHGILGSGVDNKALAAQVATDVPVDAVFALEQGTKRPKGMAAFAMGLRSFDASKAALEQAGPLVEVAPGVFKVPAKNRDLTCGLANALGPTPARLVCGGREKDLSELGPWLARTAPTQPSAHADLHGDLRWGPFDKRFGDEVRSTLKGLPMLAKAVSIDPKFDEALSDAANGLAEEVAAEATDADKLTIDFSVDPQSCVTATGALSFRGRTSWLAKVMTDRPERQGPPPAIFWRAPKESSTAFYSRGMDTAFVQGPMHVVHDLAQGWLTKSGLPAADAKAVADLLRVAVPKDTNSVSASGTYTDALPKLAGAKPQVVMDAIGKTYLGWTVMGFDKGGADVTKWFKDLAGTYSRAAVKKEITKLAGAKAAPNMPVVKVGSGPGPLGPNSVDIEVKIPNLDAPDVVASAAAKQDKVSFTFHILIMQDGKGAWIAVGANKDDLVKRLVVTKPKTPEGLTLATREGLEPLKNGKLLSGGFVTIAPLTNTMAQGVKMYGEATGGGLPMLGDVERALTTLPHRGMTPMFITSQVAPGAAPRVEMSVTVPKGTLEDIGAMVTAGMRIATKIRGGKP